LKQKLSGLTPTKASCSPLCGLLLLNLGLNNYHLVKSTHAPIFWDKMRGQFVAEKGGGLKRKGGGYLERKRGVRLSGISAPDKKTKKFPVLVGDHTFFQNLSVVFLLMLFTISLLLLRHILVCIIFPFN